MENSYRVVGQGPQKVICLNGWFGSAEGWGPFVDSLDENAFTYAFLEYRGYGRSQELRGEYTMDEIAADTLALADGLGWETFSLIGHSMGGMAIQRVLVAAPQRVEKLVALTPVPASGVPFDEQGWALFSGAAENPANRKTIIDYTTGSRLTSVWLDKMVAYSLANSNPGAFAGYLVAWAKTDFAEEVKGLEVPLLVVVGDTDPALTADFMKATYMEWYPNTKLVSMPNAGHYPMFETPVALATEIERFLAA